MEELCRRDNEDRRYPPARLGSFEITRPGIRQIQVVIPTCISAIQLSKAGKSTMIGEGVEYIHTNAHHTNPVCRVIPS